MTANLGVKALLEWVNSVNLSDREIHIDDFQDGALLLKLVAVLKKQSSLEASNDIEERFRLVAEFVERECRFRTAKGTSLSWDNIKKGINLSIEISKVLLLLLYHDMMNDRCTLMTLDSEVEQELAHLTESFVLESEGNVYLNIGLDHYLARKYLSVCREIFERSETTSTSNVSTISSLSDDSPVFHRAQKVTFVDVETVASSSLSKSPLEDVMNTPKFQVRKLKRQMIVERDYRDNLEKDLATKLALVAKRETYINQLQYRLDKLKEEQSEQEQNSRQQLKELEAKNTILQNRLNEILKENKDLKNTSSLMEHKVDELTDENGSLSSQMRAVCSQLAMFEAEVSRLTETQAITHVEWKNQTSHLQSELTQATAQKELLTEQIQILQGKISYLEDEICKASKEEVGENMGPVIEREMLETEIKCLKNELDQTVCSLGKAEMEIDAKSKQLVQFQEEISQQKELWQNQKLQSEEIIQAKDESLDKLQNDMAEERVVLQQEIHNLQHHLKLAEQQKLEQMTRLQDHITACKQEIERLKEIKQEKEVLLYQTEETVKDLRTKLSAATSLAADKEQQINNLKEQVDMLTDAAIKTKDEIQAKEQTLSNLLVEKSNEQEFFNQKILTLTAQVEDITSSLKAAESEIQQKQDLLTKSQQDNNKQTDALKQQIQLFEEELHKQNSEMQEKNVQLSTLREEMAHQSQLREQEINDLKSQLQNLKNSFRDVENQAVAKQTQFALQQEENAQEKALLQEKLSTSTEQLRSMTEEIQTREEQINLLKSESEKEAEQLHKQIQDLLNQVESLNLSFESANENLQSKESLFAEQQLKSTQHLEELQTQMVTSQEEVKRLNAELLTKEEQLAVFQINSSKHSELLQQELASLKEQRKSLSELLDIAKDHVKAKEELLVKQEQDGILKIEELKKAKVMLEQEMNSMKQDIQNKQDKIDNLKRESCQESEIFQTEIQNLRDQIQQLNQSLNSATHHLKVKGDLLVQKELEISQQKDKVQNSVETSAKEIESLKKQIQAKESELLGLRKENAGHSNILEQEITTLKLQLENTRDSLTKAEEKVQSQMDILSEQEREHALGRDILQQQLIASEDTVKCLNERIQAKENQINMLNCQHSEEAEEMRQTIQKCKNQVECLDLSLKKAEENLQSKESLFAEQQLKYTQDVEELRAQMQRSQEKVQKLNAEIEVKDEQLVRLKTDTSTHSFTVQKELENLTEQIKTMDTSLEVAMDQLKAKDDLIAQLKQNTTSKLEGLEVQVNHLTREIQTKEEEVECLKQESCRMSETLQADVRTLEDQVQAVKESLKTATEQCHAKDILLAQKEKEIAQGKDAVQNIMNTSEKEIQSLKEQMKVKEEEHLTLQKDSSLHSNSLEQEIVTLKFQLSQTSDLLIKSEENTQTHLGILNKREQSNTCERNGLLQQLTDSEEEVNKIKVEIRTKEEQMAQLKTESSEQLGLLNREIVVFRTQVETLESSLREAEQVIKTKADLMSQLQEENNQTLQILQDKAQQVVFLQEELNSRDQISNTQGELLQKAQLKADINEKLLAEVKEETSKKTDSLQKDILMLKKEVETLSLKLLAEQQNYLKNQQESSRTINLLQLQLAAAEADVEKQKETQVEKAKLQDAALREKDALFQEKEALLSRILQAEKTVEVLEKRIEDVCFEKERLAQAHQAKERENIATRKLESVLLQEVEMLKVEKEKLLKEKADKIVRTEMEFHEKLSAKSEAADHYKTQMENAVSHYNNKKQLLQKSQEEFDKLKHSFEVKEREIKAFVMEKQLLQLDLDKAQANEKALLTKVTSLEAQLAFADRSLRAQNRIPSDGSTAASSFYFEVPVTDSTCTKAEVKRSMSEDSLSQSSLDDSLNTTRKLSAPDESSTPLVRSSERLAAKRSAQRTESLETLYFTPINTRQVNRTGAEMRIGLDSTLKNPTSSVKRRRTTQINITMTKKTPSAGEDETFYSLASARSQPNLSSAHSVRPVPLELCTTPARQSSGGSDQLIGLPGYRRSTIHSQTASTFSVGAENEPDGGPEDWLRIAELQARNKAVLPHLKSSYPLECETGRSSAFIFTDEELRMGDPSDTIRRASMMPGQLQDSLLSHRQSLMLGQTGAAAGTRSHRYSLMPGQLPSKTIGFSQLTSPKDAKRTSAALYFYPTSPEVNKTKASCFPRPLTPKNKNVNSGPYHLQQALSPAKRRESTMFVIDNTPNKSYLKKGLSKLRSSTRKSPGKSSKKSPVQPSERQYQENAPNGKPRAGGGRVARSTKSPQVASKGLKKSPQTTSRAAKSPGLTASARKMMRRMKV
ncbi:nuclear mitotic apparatus protein 1 isoform X1 [Gouania willdenowi]|uniref:Nuclear mitotic apparatus protein 1 N-terminal hook domain-containing protein n=2 Tax=Gouania willdenowi TaxID=441366 RepID=A0A8C5EQC0_GOUWI|nr:nuclear mitotic apparatus protein 1 isoform X1 [Gouania willdenowi]